MIENPTLKILEHLSYVMECVLIDCLGEAKGELANLCDKVDQDSNYSIESKDQVSAELREALDYFKSGDRKVGSSKLSRVTRSLWANV